MGHSRPKRKLTGGEAVVEALESEGVKLIYGLPGISTLSVYDAIHSRKDITHITVKYEASAAIMADMQGRLTGEPGICLTVAGPGATNTVTAVSEAYDAASPILHISGVELGDGRPGYFHAVDDPDFLRKIFEPITKWSHRIEKAGDLPFDLSKAFAVTRNGRKGPVHIEIPLDVLEVSDEIVPYEKQSILEVGPSEGVISDIVSILSEAKTPLIFAGPNILRDSACLELMKLAEFLQAPVITTFYESNVIPHNHALFAGIVSCSPSQEYLEYNVSNPVLTNLLQDADVVFSIGVRLGTPESELLKAIGPRKILHLDVEENRFANEFSLRTEVVSNINITLKRLNLSFKKLGARKKGTVVEKIAEYRANIIRDMQRILEENDKMKPIHPAKAIHKLRCALEKDAIVISDIGMCQEWLTNFFEVYTANSYFDPGNYGSMGFALPAAIAAKALFPERQVVAVAGDGCFLMSLQEFQTAVENKLNIIVVVLNDSKYNTIWHIQKNRFNGRFTAVDLFPSDFSRYAKACGARGVRVEEPSLLGEAYEEALSSRTPTIIDVVIDHKYDPADCCKWESLPFRHSRNRNSQYT